MLGCLIMAALPSALYAQEAVSDSLHTALQEVEIMSIRATGTTPVAYTNIGREELSRSNTGVDFPYLVSMTPSAVATSDAGAGILSVYILTLTLFRRLEDLNCVILPTIPSEKLWGSS